MLYSGQTHHIHYMSSTSVETAECDDDSLQNVQTVEA